MMIHIQEIAWRNQAELFQIWSDDPYVTWLDSASTADPRGRYGYLCVEPFQVLEARGACVAVNGTFVAGDPFQTLQRELARWRLEPGPAPVPFAGGAVGFLGYELGGHLERVPQRHPDGLGIPDMVVAFHDIVLAFDAEARRCWIFSSGFPETEPAARRRRAVTRADAVLRRLEGAPRAPSDSGRMHTDVTWRPELTRHEYEARVTRILDYIHAGDIFQANFTMRHLAPRPRGPRAADIYLQLRPQNPAPFWRFRRLWSPAHLGKRLARALLTA